MPTRHSTRLPASSEPNSETCCSKQHEYADTETRSASFSDQPHQQFRHHKLECRKVKCSGSRQDFRKCVISLENPKFSANSATMKSLTLQHSTLRTVGFLPISLIMRANCGRCSLWLPKSFVAELTVVAVAKKETKLLFETAPNNLLNNC